MDSGRPELRSSLLKDALAAVDELGAPAARIRHAMGATVGLIESASRVDWLPIDTLLHLVDASLTVLGHGAAYTHWRSTTQKVMQGPLIKPFAAGVMAVFRPSPATALALVPKMDGLLYRHTGHVTVAPDGDAGARIVHADVPAAMLMSPGWPASREAAYLATLDFLRVKDGSIQRFVDHAGSRLIFTLRWR